jgi:DNA-binding XRE family transcriptional regulator
MGFNRVCKAVVADCTQRFCKTKYSLGQAESLCCVYSLVVYSDFLSLSRVNYETYDIMNEEIGDFYEMSLVEIRDYRGLSRRQLSQMIGKNVSEDTLYSIEKRKQVPRVDTAIAICKALGISLKQFCYSIGLDVSSLADDCLPSKDTQCLTPNNRSPK